MAELALIDGQRKSREITYICTLHLILLVVYTLLSCAISILSQPISINFIPPGRIPLKSAIRVPNKTYEHRNADLLGFFKHDGGGIYGTPSSDEYVTLDFVNEGAFKETNDDYVNEQINLNPGSGTKAPVMLLPNQDSPLLDDLVSEAISNGLPTMNDEILYQQHKYLTSPGFRDQATDSVNLWLRGSTKSATKLKELVNTLYSENLKLDHVEVGPSPRGGKASTHELYGQTQTVNSATFLCAQATEIRNEISNPSCLRIYMEQGQDSFVGQSHDLFGAHNGLCPSISNYMKMIEMKTGGLFRLLTQLMIADSPVYKYLSDGELNYLGYLIGRFSQVRDDYNSMALVEYAKQNGLTEIDGGEKHSFTLIHCIQTLDRNYQLATEKTRLRSFLIKRGVDEVLNTKAKREIWSIMKMDNNMGYTRSVLGELQKELEKEVRSLETNLGIENFTLGLMLAMPAQQSLIR